LSESREAELRKVREEAAAKVSEKVVKECKTLIDAALISLMGPGVLMPGWKKLGPG